MRELSAELVINDGSESGAKGIAKPDQRAADRSCNCGTAPVFPCNLFARRDQKQDSGTNNKKFDDGRARLRQIRVHSQNHTAYRFEDSGAMTLRTVAPLIIRGRFTIVASDEFVDRLFGVGLVKAQEFFFGHASIVITLDLYGSPVEGLMD